MSTVTTLTIRRPDDWHVHFRDDDMLKTVVPYTSEFWPCNCHAEFSATSHND